jgi:hypothetical protein
MQINCLLEERRAPAAVNDETKIDGTLQKNGEKPKCSLDLPPFFLAVRFVSNAYD